MTWVDQNSTCPVVVSLRAKQRRSLNMLPYFSDRIPGRCTWQHARACPASSPSQRAGYRAFGIRQVSNTQDCLSPGELLWVQYRELHRRGTSLPYLDHRGRDGRGRGCSAFPVKVNREGILSHFRVCSEFGSLFISHHWPSRSQSIATVTVPEPHPPCSAAIQSSLR